MRTLRTFPTTASIFAASITYEIIFLPSVLVVMFEDGLTTGC